MILDNIHSLGINPALTLVSIVTLNILILQLYKIKFLEIFSSSA